MAYDKETAAKNFSEFFAKFGKEGLARLFLTNYLLELVLYYLHSQSKDVEDDTSLSFYISSSKKRTFSPSEIEKFREDLRTQCDKKAAEIIEELKKKNLFDRLDEDLYDHNKVEPLIEQSVRDILSKIERD